jgi:two-component system, sensor histidine kinase and response regulator
LEGAVMALSDMRGPIEGREADVVSVCDEGKTPLRCLVVDDSTDNRLLIRSYLSKLSCEVDEAENGEICVNKFISGAYDLVLMDLHMPVMDGIKATRRIRQWETRQGAGRVCVIALTASAFDDEILEMRAAGADFELRKPVNKMALAEAIETAIEMRAGETRATPRIS